jgi:hypothetical protein
MMMKELTIHAAINAVLPFQYFYLLSSEGHQGYADFAVEGRVANAGIKMNIDPR